MFPEGVRFDYENKHVRSFKVNKLFELNAELSSVTASTNKNSLDEKSRLLSSVAGTGFEPMTSGL